METRTSLIAALIASVACFAWSSPASAQSAGPVRNAPQNPAQNPVSGGLPPHEIMSIVRATGFEPIGRPVRNGQTYVLRALDPYDLHVHVVVDARSGRIVSVGEAAPRSAAPAGYRPAPMYDPYDAPVYGRIFGPADDGYAPARPPGNVPGVKPHPKVTAAAPMPRPRPYVRDATGSIDTPASHDSAPPPAQKNPEPPKDNGITLPPVAPLD